MFVLYCVDFRSRIPQHVEFLRAADFLLDIGQKGRVCRKRDVHVNVGPYLMQRGWQWLLGQRLQSAEP